MNRDHRNDVGGSPSASTPQADMERYLDALLHALRYAPAAERVEIAYNAKEQLDAAHVTGGDAGLTKALATMPPPEQYAEDYPAPPGAGDGTAAAPRKASSPWVLGVAVVMAMTFAIITIVGTFIYVVPTNRPSTAPVPPVAAPAAGATITSTTTGPSDAFVDDPAVVGVWKAVDLTEFPRAYTLSRAPEWKEDLMVNGLVFGSEGMLEWRFPRVALRTRWTNGRVLPFPSQPADAPQAHYERRVVDGQERLFVQFITNDVIHLGATPKWYVLTRVSELLPIPLATAQTVDLSEFVDDPEVVGVWKAVDFTDSPNAYAPSLGREQKEEDLVFAGLVFDSDGTVLWRLTGGGSRRTAWSRGLVESLQSPGYPDPAHYERRTVDGQEYLFVEFISGNVVLFGVVPKWYVYVRESDIPLP
ncbi:MAG: hypothetical protein FWE88_00540 [Phycisphaerae bacterium]|nr:hypothetical protein [Phycisphaerae bacterium]